MRMEGEEGEGEREEKKEGGTEGEEVEGDWEEKERVKAKEGKRRLIEVSSVLYVYENEGKEVEGKKGREGGGRMRRQRKEKEAEMKCLSSSL